VDKAFQEGITLMKDEEEDDEHAVTTEPVDSSPSERADTPLVSYTLNADQRKAWTAESWLRHAEEILWLNGPGKPPTQKAVELVLGMKAVPDDYKRWIRKCVENEWRTDDGKHFDLKTDEHFQRLRAKLIDHLNKDGPRTQSLYEAHAGNLINIVKKVQLLAKYGLDIQASLWLQNTRHLFHALVYALHELRAVELEHGKSVWFEPVGQAERSTTTIEQALRPVERQLAVMRTRQPHTADFQRPIEPWMAEQMLSHQAASISVIDSLSLLTDFEGSFFDACSHANAIIVRVSAAIEESMKNINLFKVLNEEDRDRLYAH